MNKLFFTFIFIYLFSTQNSFSLNPTYKDKLIVTCKIYGFMKYYHSEVSTCKVDWDQSTRELLTLIKDDIDIDSFNTLIKNWIDSAGPMERTNTSLPNISSELSINLNTNWTSHVIIKQEIKERLDTVKYYFRPHPSCWVKDNDFLSNNYSWLIFPKDSNTYKDFIVKTMPDETTRALSVFKYWNIIRYFSPNNDITTKSWDLALNDHVEPLVTNNNLFSYYFNFKKMSSYLNDVHAEGLTTARFISPPTYYYSPMLVLKYVENKYMVVESAENGITRGFIVNKVNGISVANMEDSLRPYLSSGNDAVFHRSVSSLILNGSPNSTVNVEFIDNSGAILSKVLSRSTYIYQQFFYNYYPNDTLKNVAYKKISCGVGYVNMGILQRNEVSAMYNSLKDAPAIIFDIRNYPNGTVFQIADFMFPNKTVCAKFKIPDVNYPGTFYWDSTSFGYNNNSDAYNGKVILLVDEETQSHAEYSAMILKAFPGAMVVGSQTAGADGNVVNFNASWDIKLGYTGVGVYWPDGTNTQRVGIAVDVASNPTRVKLTARRDEVLEAGLKLANCFVSDINLLLVNQFNIYPNPSTGIFKIETNFSTYTYKIFNSLGKEVSSEVTNESNEIDLSGFENGIYTVVVYHDNQIESKKITLMR